MDVAPWIWVVFVAWVVGVLLVDVLVFHRKAQEVALREAASWTAVWLALALGFGAVVWAWRGGEDATAYLTGYVIERSLSVDNVIVLAAVFAYFAVEPAYRHRARVVRHREDRRDRIGGERDVGRRDRDEDGEHRRRDEPPVDADEEPLPVVGGRHRHDAAKDAHDEVPLRARTDLAERESQAGQDEKRIEGVDGPGAVLERGGAAGDERGPQHEGAEHSDDESRGDRPRRDVGAP